jgi:hypothetical protein
LIVTTDIFMSSFGFFCHTVGNEPKHRMCKIDIHSQPFADSEQNAVILYTFFSILAREYLNVHKLFTFMITQF